MTTFIDIAQIVIAILLSAAILVQQRGGLSSIFGGGDTSFYSTRRGAEKIIFWATIVLSILFLGTALLRFL